jgi:Cu(I)/Ag(I) efflux system membrane protein CusA/SilA
MINRVIHWSIHNRFLVLFATILIVAWGVYAVKRTPVDAIPDLSDVQVIIKTSFPGWSPTVIQDQITYPLSTTMMSVPGSKVVRGYSFFGDSFVYVLFEDGTDLYWARSRVLEYLNQVIGRLPAGVTPIMGPDATGVGWVYEYALVDRTGRHDLSQLRSLQDWFLRYELLKVPGVAEVAPIGGMVKTYQIIVDPNKLRAYQMPISKLIEAVKRANQETGGSVIELAEAEYMVRATGYLQSIQDIENIPLGMGKEGIPILLKDVAHVQIGPQIRRGVAELNGQGEVTGGIVVMRFGKNAQETIKGVKEKLIELKGSLPKGVEIIPTYDRSGLINRAITNLWRTLAEESLIVALVCLVFLFHLRSSLVAIVTLPIGILIAFIIMHSQGINANIMSLGGIAIAIGAMIDAAIVMIENAHKKIEAWHHQFPDQALPLDEHMKLIMAAASEVGPALFFSLLIITISFVPIFTLEAQEGRLFSPLAFTKTYAMAAAAALSITLVPVLMYYFIRGKIRDEANNPLNRLLLKAYRPAIHKVLQFPKTTLVIALILLLFSLIPIARIGSEFMPPLMEGDLLYMPTAFPGLSIGKATQLLQQTDKLIASVPEVKSVFGKAGRADTATDPAPIEMFETLVQLKPPSQWRSGMTLNKLIAELDKVVKVPGLVNVWVPPIRNRIDMLSTGIKSPLGIKIIGKDLNTIDKIGRQIEALLNDVRGTTSIFSERLVTGRYINIVINRQTAARYGLNIADVQEIISRAIGGENIGESIQGLERYPINLRYPRDWRNSLQTLRDIPILTMQGEIIPLSNVADVSIVDGPPMIKSENARLTGWVYIDVRDRDIGSYVKEAKKRIKEKIQLPSGYTLNWSGQYEYMQRAAKRMMMVIPFTLLIILLLLYLIFRRVGETLLIIGTLPFALIGGFWLVYLLGFNLSVAVAVGFIALGGIATEFGVVMLIYLDLAVKRYQDEKRLNSYSDLKQAVMEGTALRLRPLAMTASVIIAGLLPIMLSHGTGSDVMQRLAAPMIGGMISAFILSLFVVPAVYLLWKGREYKNE